MSEPETAAEPWVCAGCGQKNAGWSKECGRCESTKAVLHLERLLDPERVARQYHRLFCSMREKADRDGPTDDDRAMARALCAAILADAALTDPEP